VLWTFHLFSTLSGGPFESLLPEIAPTSRERVSIVTWQVFFGTIGAFIALVVSGIIIDFAGFQAMALTMAVLALGSRYLGLAGAWRYTRLDVEPATVGAWEAFRATLRNDQFLYYLPTFILFNMAISMMTATLPFWTSAVLMKGFPEEIAGQAPKAPKLDTKPSNQVESLRRALKQTRRELEAILALLK